MIHLNLFEEFMEGQEKQGNLYWGVVHGEDCKFGSTKLLLCPFKDGIPPKGTWCLPEPDWDDMDESPCDHLRLFHTEGEDIGDPLNDEDQPQKWQDCMVEVMEEFQDNWDVNYADETKIMENIYLICATGDYETIQLDDYTFPALLFDDNKIYDDPTQEHWLALMRGSSYIKFIQPIFSYDLPSEGSDSLIAITNFITEGINEGKLNNYIGIINILKDNGYNLPVNEIDLNKATKLSRAYLLLKRK